MDLNKLLVLDPYSNPASFAQRWNMWIRNFERSVVPANNKTAQNSETTFTPFPSHIRLYNRPTTKGLYLGQ